VFFRYFIFGVVLLYGFCSVGIKKKKLRKPHDATELFLASSTHLPDGEGRARRGQPCGSDSWNAVYINDVIQKKLKKWRYEYRTAIQFKIAINYFLLINQKLKGLPFYSYYIYTLQYTAQIQRLLRLYCLGHDLFPCQAVNLNPNRSC